MIETDFQNSTASNSFMVDGVSYSFSGYMDQFVPDQIRKKVQDLSKPEKKDSGTFFNTTKHTKKGNEDMDGDAKKTEQAITDAAQLKQAYPALCDQIAADAVAAERARIKAIDEIAGNIPADMLEKAKYEEPVSAADLALACMKADNHAGKEFLNQMVEEMQNSGADEVGAEPNTGYDPEAQKRAENAQKVSGFAAVLKKDKRRGKE